MVRGFAHPILVGVLAFVAIGAQLAQLGPLLRTEAAAHDAVARMGRKAVADPQLLFLAVDTASASLDQTADLDALLDIGHADPESRRALQLMAQSWPWPREVHGLVLDRLVRAGARAVLFDFTFPKPSANDDAFRDMLERHRDRVVVASNISEDHAHAGIASAHALAVPSATLIPAAPERDPRLGFDNFWPDQDEIVRHAHYRWAPRAGVWQGAEELSLGARGLQQAGLASVIPADGHERRFRFAGSAGTFAPRPIFEIFAPRYWRQNFGDGAALRGRIVVIGASGNWQQDVHLTPMGMMPGPELHLNAINAALHGDFLHESPPGAAIAVIGVFAGIALLLRRAIRRPTLRFAAQFALTAGWGGVALLLFDHAALLVPIVAPLLCFNLAGISGLAHDIVAERREKAHLRRTLIRYVSRNVVDEVMQDGTELARALGGEMRDVTVLFSDIRGFSLKAREMKSAELVAQLNEYFSAMVACVFRFDGTLDKFIGDAVMAVWGNARTTHPANDARNAVACGLAMFEELDKLNQRWAREGRPQFRIGVGINSGPAIVGNIGSPERMEFTVIGDAVNIAWRLQERTKGEHHLLLGESVLPLLNDDFPTEIVGEFSPTGDTPIAYARLVEAHAVAVS